MLDSCTEVEILGKLTRELSHWYCLNLPDQPSLERGCMSPLLELGKNKLVLVVMSLTSRISALLPATVA